MDLFKVQNKSITFDSIFINEAVSSTTGSVKSIAQQLNVRRPNPSTGQKWTNDEIVNYVKSNVKALLYSADLGLMPSGEDGVLENTERAMPYDEKLLRNFIKNMKSRLINKILDEIDETKLKTNERQILDEYKAAKENHKKLKAEYDDLRKQISQTYTETKELNPETDKHSDYLNDYRTAENNIKRLSALAQNALNDEQKTAYKESKAIVADAEKRIKENAELSPEESQAYDEAKNTLQELESIKDKFLNSNAQPDKSTGKPMPYKVILQNAKDIIEKYKKEFQEFKALDERREQLAKELSDSERKNIMEAEKKFMNSIGRAFESDEHILIDQDAYTKILTKFNKDLMGFEKVIALLSDVPGEFTQDKDAQEYAQNAKDITTAYQNAMKEYLPDLYHKLVEKHSGTYTVKRKGQTTEVESKASKYISGLEKRAESVWDIYVRELLKDMPVLTSAFKTILKYVEPGSKLDQSMRLFIKIEEVINQSKAAQAAKANRSEKSAEQPEAEQDAQGTDSLHKRAAEHMRKTLSRADRYTDAEVDAILEEMPEISEHKLIGDLTTLLFQKSSHESQEVLSSKEELKDRVAPIGIPVDDIDSLYENKPADVIRSLNQAVDEISDIKDKLFKYYNRWNDANKIAKKAANPTDPKTGEKIGTAFWSDTDTQTDDENAQLQDQSDMAPSIGELFEDIKAAEETFRKKLLAIHKKSISPYTTMGISTGMAGAQEEDEVVTKKGRGTADLDDMVMQFTSDAPYVGFKFMDRSMPSMVLASIPVNEFKYVRDGIHHEGYSKNIQRVSKLMDELKGKINELYKNTGGSEQGLIIDTLNKIKSHIVGAQSDEVLDDIIDSFEDAGPEGINDVIEYANNNLGKSIELDQEGKKQMSVLIKELTQYKSALIEYRSKYKELQNTLKGMYIDGVYYTGDVGIATSAEGEAVSGKSEYTIKLIGSGEQFKLKNRPCDVGLIVADKASTIKFGEGTKSIDWKTINELYDRYMEAMKSGDPKKKGSAVDDFMRITDGLGNLRVAFNIIVYPKETLIDETKIWRKLKAKGAYGKKGMFGEYATATGFTVRPSKNMVNHMDVGYKTGTGKFVKIGYIPQELADKGKNDKGRFLFAWILGSETDPLYKVISWRSDANKETIGMLYDIDEPDVENILNARAMIIDEEGNYTPIEFVKDPETGKNRFASKGKVYSALNGTVIKDYGDTAKLDLSSVDSKIATISSTIRRQFQTIMSMYSGITLPPKVEAAAAKVSEIPIEDIYAVGISDLEEMKPEKTVAPAEGTEKRRRGRPSKQKEPAEFSQETSIISQD